MNMAYSKEQIEERFNNILTYIRQGKALRNCFDKEDTFSSQVWSKIIVEADKNEQYARACEERADKIFEEIIDIADSVENDLIVLPDGREVVNHSVINRDRLRVDARKWIVAKMNPKKYGDKIEQNVNLNTEQPIFKGIDLDVRENNSST